MIRSENRWRQCRTYQLDYGEGEETRQRPQHRRHQLPFHSRRRQTSDSGCSVDERRHCLDLRHRSLQTRDVVRGDPIDSVVSLRSVQIGGVDEQFHHVQRYRRNLHAHVPDGEEGRLSRLLEYSSKINDERNDEIPRFSRLADRTIVGSRSQSVHWNFLSFRLVD